MLIYIAQERYKLQGMTGERGALSSAYSSKEKAIAAMKERFENAKKLIPAMGEWADLTDVVERKTSIHIADGKGQYYLAAVIERVLL